MCYTRLDYAAYCHDSMQEITEPEEIFRDSQMQPSSFQTNLTESESWDPNSDVVQAIPTYKMGNDRDGFPGMSLHLLYCD